MEPSVIIPRDKLKIWDIFRDVGPEGEEILKTAKLAHPADTKEGFVVTTTDETYSFHWTCGGDGWIIEVTRIPELCGVRVKEFVTNHCIFLAVTEDGFLYSWISDYSLSLNGEKPDFYIIGELFRLNSTENIDWSSPEVRDQVLNPHRVLGTLAGEKVQQAATAFGRLVALTVSGYVYRWVAGLCSEPVLIDKEHFEGDEVISIACNVNAFLVLTCNGKIFQWEYDVPPKKAGYGTARFKKIAASGSSLFALSVDGALHWWKNKAYCETSTWKIVFENQKFQDVATTGKIDAVVVETMDNARFAFADDADNFGPYGSNVASFSPSSASMEEFLAEQHASSPHTIRADAKVKPRTVSDDISNAWVTKENADVTFSVEGKTITAHKLILTLRSDYFAKMFNSEWKEANKGSEIEIKDATYDVFQALLFYIYNDKISFPEDEYENICALMKLADYHCAINIRLECEKLLVRNITPENAAFLAQNASLANASELEKNVLNFMEDMPACRSVTSQTD